MSIADNKEVIRRFYDECWNTGNLDVIGTFVAPSYREAYTDGMRSVRAGFPDLHWTLDELIAEGDRVVNRWTLRGTHRGEYAGIAPSGRAVNWPGVTIFQLVDGTIAGRAVFADLGELRRQLGATG